MQLANQFRFDFDRPAAHLDLHRPASVDARLEALLDVFGDVTLQQRGHGQTRRRVRSQHLVRGPSLARRRKGADRLFQTRA